MFTKINRVNIFLYKLIYIFFCNLPGISVFEVLNEILETMMLDLKRPFLAALTEDIHVLPDFHGNR